jgi:hypothetical protein
MRHESDHGHLLARDGLGFGIGAAVQFTAQTHKPVAVRVAPIRFTITARLTSGCPRQLAGRQGGRRRAKRVGVGKEGKKAAELAAIQISAKLTSGDVEVLSPPPEPRPGVRRSRSTPSDWGNPPDTPWASSSLFFASVFETMPEAARRPRPARWPPLRARVSTRATRTARATSSIREAMSTCRRAAGTRGRDHRAGAPGA